MLFKMFKGCIGLMEQTLSRKGIGYGSPRCSVLEGLPSGMVDNRTITFVVYVKSIV